MAKRRNKVDSAGANIRREIVNVSDLMVDEVVTVTPETSFGEVRQRMAALGVHAIPVVDREDRPVGIITSTDMLDPPSDETPVGEVMSREVQRIPSYSRIHDAARAMLKHRIHHLVVTNEQRVVGILSSFDILHLVADRRFVMKGNGGKTWRNGAEAAEGSEP